MALPAMPAPPPNRPVGVTVIAVLAFIAAGFILLAAAILLVGGAALATAFSAAFPGWLQGLVGTLAVALALVLAALGVLYLLGGIGLLKGRPWAWTVTIVLSIIGAVNALLTLPGGIVGLALNLLVIWYFFTPPVKAYFSKGHVKTPWERAPAQT